MAAIAAAPPRSWLLRPNALWGLVLAAAGFYAGGRLGAPVGETFDYVGNSDQNDVALFTAYGGATVGWFAGLGFLGYPLRRLLGEPPSLPHYDARGLGRYFRNSPDHKVVALQYLVTVFAFLLIGGINAMLIRVELLSPAGSTFAPDAYLTLVALHGVTMLVVMTSAIVGPFANYFVPLMLGAQRLAFPRLESFTFWLLPLAGVAFLLTVFYGGVPTGWTGYAPLSIQGQSGMDSYIVAFALTAVSLTLTGLNLITTVITMRAPGLTWNRLPIFAWAVVATSVMMLLAGPVLFTTLVMAGLDRTIDTSFFVPGGGGSAFLWENLFWFFGHPEVYILALPGMGVVLEILPVFARRPLWGYRLAVAGLLGVSLASFLVWQHHLFVSGVAADIRPFFMFTTEFISVPTGVIFLIAMGTLWRARLRYGVPVLFALAWFFNFLIGGLSGIFLSDVATDVTLHGSYAVLAHFHYTIMGGLVFAFFAAIYYWLPKMTGFRFHEGLAKLHFWTMFVAFNSTFLALFAVGFLGMPRRVVVYEQGLELLNVWASISAFVLGVSMLVFVANLVYSMLLARQPETDNPWQSLSLEWQLSSPVPVHNFDRQPVVGGGPYEYGVPNAAPVADLPGPTPRPAGAGASP